MFRSAIIVISSALLAACGANLTASRVPLPPKDCLCGVVVRQPVPYSTYAIFPETPDSKVFKVQAGKAMLPSEKEAYVLGYRGALFSSHELTVTLNPDGSIQEAKITGDLQAAKALDAIAKNADTFAKTQKTLKEEEQKSQKDPLDTENESLKKEIKNMMLKANKDALEQGVPLPYPNATN